MEKLLELLALDTPDGIGVVYPSSVVIDAARTFDNRIQESEDKGIFGERSAPKYASDRGVPYDFYSIDISRISHLVKHIWVENKKLMCKIKLLNEFVEMEKNDEPIFGSVRATGVVNENKICTHYNIITVDLIIPEA